jgi:biopolymer transport protein ExbD
LTPKQAGELFLNRESIARRDLGQRVKAALAVEPALTVIMNADGEVRHSAVVEIMDELRLAGVSSLAIAVKPDKQLQ